MQHVTLDTGDVRWSPREEVATDLLPAIAAHLYRALSAHDPIPNVDGWSAHATAEADILLVTVSRDLRDARAPIVTFGVTAVPAQVAVLDGLLRRVFRADLAPLAELVYLRGPWLLVRLLPTIALVADDPTSIGWLGDYERCIAWAFLDGPAAAGVH